METLVELPDEAPDMTASEAHQLLIHRLYGLLTAVLGSDALVLSEIFVRVNDTTQVSAALMIIPGATPAERTSYRIPPEPVPAVTIELLSPANHRHDGYLELTAKRELFGGLGVPIHIEIDPARKAIFVWSNDNGVLIPEPAITRYDGLDLGGVAIDTAGDMVHLFTPDGREYLTPAAETARADAATAQANAATARAEQLAAQLRELGVDPDAV